MSELKTRMLGQTMSEYGCDTKIYLKSEADKVIAEKDKEIARLDDLAHAHNIELLRKENLIAEVKAKLESVQATAYAESVDAGMENRKLKRAMWLARANDASSFAGLFSTLSYIDDESRTYWIFGNKRKIVFDELKCSRMETAYKWFCIWDDVANKCLKKAKEYK